MDLITSGDNCIEKEAVTSTDSNATVIEHATRMIDFRGGILGCPKTGVSLIIPEGAIDEGVSLSLLFFFDIWFHRFIVLFRRLVCQTSEMSKWFFVQKCYFDRYSLIDQKFLSKFERKQPDVAVFQVQQEIYLKVCRASDAGNRPPLDKSRGESLMSPLVMCGPQDLQFNVPVELR